MHFKPLSTLWSKSFVLVIDNDSFAKHKICVHVCEVHDALANVSKINNNRHHRPWIIYKWLYEFIHDIFDVYVLKIRL